MDDVEVRPAGPADWERVKAVRLRALADAPYAFASTLAREQAFDDAEWQHRAAAGNWMLALAQGRAVGVAAGFARNEDPAERHLVAMWVEPARRGTPIATALVWAVCRWAQSESASSITLWVADGNERARRLYERLGFRSTGERTPLPSNPSMGEELMSLALPMPALPTPALP